MVESNTKFLCLDILLAPISLSLYLSISISLSLSLSIYLSISLSLSLSLSQVGAAPPRGIMLYGRSGFGGEHVHPFRVWG